MFVVIEHSISDLESFWGAAETITDGMPESIKAHQFMPSANHEKAVCLWEGPSVEAIQNFLEPKIGQSSTNVYYEVDSEKAMGLPAQQSAQAGASES